MNERDPWLEELQYRYDLGYLQYPSSHSHTIVTSSNTSSYDQFRREFREELRSRYQERPQMGDVLSQLLKAKAKKEKPEMGYNDYDNRDRRSSQEKIDDAVREAIEAPRRAAEIERRVAAVTALEPVLALPVGSVFTFNKKYDGAKDETTFAAIKTADNVWAVTGDGRYSNGQRYSVSDLMHFLTTGTDLATAVKTASKFDTVL